MLDHKLFVEQKQSGDNQAEFVVEPLTAGYGHTLGNSIRRVLLSSLKGAAADSVQIDGADHEFATLPKVNEDVVEIILNIKQIRFDLKTDEATLTLEKSGKGVVTAGDFAPNAECAPNDPQQVIANLDTGGSISMRVTVKKGQGYETIEMKTERAKAVGMIYVDSSFSPVVSASYRVEKTRVGQETNLDKVILSVETDGSVTPEDAIKEACQILVDQYIQIGKLPEPVEEVEEPITVNETLVELPEISPKTKIEDAALSSRTTNALLAAGYKTISGLIRLSDLKLESIKGLGSKGLEEVKAALERVGSDE